MRTIAAVEPVKATFPDGQERAFLLTRGGMTRLKRQLDILTDAELLGLPAEKLMGPLLVEAERDPKTLTAANVEDVLPVDIDWTARLVLAILGASMPDPRPIPPETTAPAPSIQ